MRSNPTFVTNLCEAVVSFSFEGLLQPASQYGWLAVFFDLLPVLLGICFFFGRFAVLETIVVVERLQSSTKQSMCLESRDKSCAWSSNQGAHRLSKSTELSSPLSLWNPNIPSCYHPPKKMAPACLSRCESCFATCKSGPRRALPRLRWRFSSSIPVPGNSQASAHGGRDG